MSNDSKPDARHPNANTGKYGADNKKTRVAGDVHVRGEIVVDLGPEEKLSRHSDQEKKNSHDRKKFWLEGASFVVLTFYAGVTTVQSCQIKSGNDTSRESLQSVQRSFVFARPLVPNINIDNQASGPVKTVEFYITWENSGNTPAVNDFHYMSASAMNREPDEDEFVGQRPLPPEAISAPIAPRSTQDTGKVSIKYDLLIDDTLPHVSSDNGKGVSVWGWVVYRDIFANTPIHLTEVCLRAASFWRSDNSPTPPRMTFVPCKHHNCEDDLCSDYEQVTSLAVGR